MIIAVITVTVMQLPIAEIIEMVAVRNACVTLCLVIAGASDWHTSGGIRSANRDGVLVIVVAMEKMQVTIVQIVDMAFVHHSQVATILSMNMGMFAGMDRMAHS